MSFVHVVKFVNFVDEVLEVKELNNCMYNCKVILKCTYSYAKKLCMYVCIVCGLHHHCGYSSPSMYHGGQTVTAFAVRRHHF